MGLVLADSEGARYWIEKLSLEPHPEGGYFRVTYAAELALSKESLPSQYKGSRPASTAIYFLLDSENFSAFHRIQSDELWHFYAGDPLVVHVIDQSGKLSEILLGSDVEAGQVFQSSVKAGCWFASELKPGGSFGLVGCTVAPGFDFDDFELGKQEDLQQIYPQHKKLIEKLTRS